MEFLYNILNFIIFAINQILHFINGLFGNQSFVGVFSALLGAVVGSVGGYVFNARLERQRSNERFWIQRKNTVYSPIYKMLLSLREYLKAISTKDRPFIYIQFESDSDSYNTFNFTLWESIKRDVRYDYIPEDLRIPLEELASKLQSQLSLQDGLNIGWKFRIEYFVKNNRNIFDKEKVKKFNFVGSLLYAAENRFFPRTKTDKNFIRQLLNDNAKEGHKKNITKVLRNLERELQDVHDFKALRPSLTKIIIYTDYAIEVYRKRIKQIITAYEGGVKLE